MDAALHEPVLIIKTAWGWKSLHTDFRPPSAGPYQLNDYQKKLYYGPPGHGVAVGGGARPARQGVLPGDDRPGDLGLEGQPLDGAGVAPQHRLQHGEVVDPVPENALVPIEDLALPEHPPERFGLDRAELDAQALEAAHDLGQPDVAG